MADEDDFPQSDADQPLISYTLGPDVQYACPAVSRPEGTNLATYAVIRRSQGIDNSLESRTIWAWTSFPEDPTTLAADRKSYQAPFPVYALYAPRSLPSKLLVVSSTGTVACLGGEEMLPFENSSTQGGTSSTGVLKSIIIPRQRCSFAPTTVPPSAVLLTVLQDAQETPELRLNVTVFDDDGNIDASASGTVDLSNGTNLLLQTIRDVTIDHAGNFSVLWSDLSWSLYTLSRPSLSEPLVLTHHEPQVQLSQHKLTTLTSTSLIHLNTTHILFASLEPGQQNADILIWDLQYQALLAHRTLSLPSGIPNSQIQLVSTLDTTHALLVVSTSPAKTRGSATSFVYSVPLTVPATSSLANAINAAQSTSADDWVEHDGEEVAGAEGLMIASERQTLNKLDDVLRRQGVQAANDVVLQFQQSTGLVNLSRDFAAEVCKRLLQPLPKATESGKAGKVPSSVTPLLERGLVSNGCVPHEMGVVGAILDRSDWVALRLCLRQVKDIPEDALVQVLKRVILANANDSSLTVNGMDVDSTSSPKRQSAQSDVPSIQEFLVQLVQYPTTAGSLRVAMKKHLSIGSDYRERTARHFGNDDEGSQEIALCSGKSSRPATCTSLSPTDLNTIVTQSVQFFQHILDTFLLSILSSSTSTSATQPEQQQLQTSMLSISTHIQNSISLISALEKLRGPLEPFVRAQEERMLAEKERAANTGHTEQKWAKLRKRSERHKKMDEAVAVYQIEKLTL
ncbi:hypothetical protein M407DRAFT_4307 [Tulasnella calospora MUT 4182]|uniref:Uncharacterized protein n=1 Tax=Tulasnella calospora MUT 4182 TaxID=1051891 RepID=A0A0C3QK56_9AGAM|nr:hypothetical protein M407DRAFT_4307 [Tulasnella calospora MUT 4182]